jgi:hypothetical protein
MQVTIHFPHPNPEVQITEAHTGFTITYDCFYSLNTDGTGALNFYASDWQPEDYKLFVSTLSIPTVDFSTYITDLGMYNQVSGEGPIIDQTVSYTSFVTPAFVALANDMLVDSVDFRPYHQSITFNTDSRFLELALTEYLDLIEKKLI